MVNSLLILFGKLIIWFSKATNRGNGSTWPGHIALKANKNFIREILGKNSPSSPPSPKERRSVPSPLEGEGRVRGLKTILVVGTNGKTTTSKLIRTILEKNEKRVIQNESGANLVNGIASTLIQYCNIAGKVNADFAIFEIDENTLPHILKELTPDYVIVLNLFRDQLDRYGEVNAIAKNWDKALDSLPFSSTILLNADDPQIAYMGMNLVKKRYSSSEAQRSREVSSRQARTILYFGLSEQDAAKEKTHQVVDSTYCPNCGHKLTYKKIFFSHLGIWECESCNRKRPLVDVDSFLTYPLSGLYNKYNTHAAVLLVRTLEISDKDIQNALSNFDAAFGRQETLVVNGKKVQIFLSKNPTSFNESLRTVKELNGKHVLFVLNDRIPDGRDVSWIWDTDIEAHLNNFSTITISGDRAYDMALRVKYASENQKSKIKNQNHNSKVKIYEELPDAVNEALEKTPKDETLFIIPTYSAMLEIRKILTGKKIL